MTDRELLDLAAKAAGYVIEINYYGMDRHGLFNTEKCVPPALWNPLTDDGDALRLAVKCNLDIRFDSHENGVSVEVCGMWDYAPAGSLETFEKNGCAATRRAIVRAAAEIGMAEASKVGHE